MNEEKKIYYKYLDLIRVFFCVIVLLYHLNILKGGYLAVCGFFVLSGYLSCNSAFRKEKFSFKQYYLNRLLKIYIPLIVITFMAITFIYFFNINWLNLKPETTSVVLGYNNFWQLNANLDYFARHVDSPFMHFWYIAILLQFDLVFPIVFAFFKKIGDKLNKIVPCVILFGLSIALSIYFYKVSIDGNMMLSYYNTFARIFSLIFGVLLGFITSYYKTLISNLLKNQILNKIIFYFYIIILCFMFCLIDANSIYYSSSMILTTLITCRLIRYSAVILDKKNFNIIDKIIKSFSKISYEVYLLQYPIIFLFKDINIEMHLKVFLIILLTIMISYILHFILDKNGKYKILKYILRIIMLSVVLFGVYQYVITKDHTYEMKQLENQLAQNELMMQQKQEEYEQTAKQEQQDLEKLLNDIENDESKLTDIIDNLQIVGIGDSVMLGATPNLYDKFPNGYFDAKISRTAWVVNGILQDLKNNNKLGNPIVLNVGANGDCSISCKIQIINTCEDREIFWVNVTNDKDVNVNSELSNLANNYKNLHVIDWNSISKGHFEYFISDGIHLTEIGKKEYVNAIYNSIYNFYLDEYKLKREEIINKHEQNLKTKISFYGNDILLNAFDYIQEEFSTAKFIIKKDFDYNELKVQIENSIKDETLTNKIVFAFDDSMKLSELEYYELIELCDGHELYFLSINEDTNIYFANLNYNNVTLIDFYNEIKNNNYFMPDRIHLTNEGNRALSYMLKSTIQ